MDKLKTVMALAVALLIAGPMGVAEAETPELITDRPDFTESSSAVPPGHVQAEMGVTASLSDPVHEIVFPSLLLRVGVLRHLELRVGAPSATVTWSDGGEAETSAAPLELGAKLARSWGPASAGLLPYVMLPVQRHQYDSDGVAVGLKGLWSVDLSEHFSLGGNVGVEIGGLGADEDQGAWDASASLALGIAITDRLGTFVELYSLFSADEVQPFGQTGLVYLLVDNIQLDLFGAMLLDQQPAGQVGMGASLLF